MRITVFASSSPRTRRKYLFGQEAVADACVTAGVTVINGAGNNGCMGALNERLLALNGQVEGVILRKFHEGLWR